MVVHFAEKDERLKIKQDDYVILHRLVTGLNERRIWEALSQGKSDVDILAPLPEEFADWAGKVISRLKTAHTALYWQITERYQSLMTGDELPELYSRKDFALQASRSEYAGYLFKLYDQRDISEAIWKELKPDFRQGPWSQTEDTA